MNQTMGTSYPEKPGMVTAIAVLTLINGIVNIFWGLGISIAAISTFIGICATPFTILPTVLGIFEIIFAVKLLADPPQPVHPNQTLAILEIVMIIAGNVFSTVVGTLVLIFYADPTVRQYFAWLNGQPLPAAPAPPIPAAPENHPALPEEPQKPVAPKTPAASKKPAARKAAAKKAYTKTPRTPAEKKAAAKTPRKPAAKKAPKKTSGTEKTE